MKSEKNLFLYFSLLIIMSLSWSCRKQEGNYFNATVSSARNIMIDSLVFDTIYFDPIQSSYVGKFQQYSDTIYFADQMFCNVFHYDLNGKYINRYLGSGGGPNEIPSGEIVDLRKLKNGSYVILGPSYDLYLFNHNWVRIKKLILKTDIQHSQKEIQISPKPDMQGIYDIDYERNMNMQEFRGNILVPIESLMDKFNPVMKEYYKQSRTFFEINPVNGEVVNMFGRRSPVYLNYNCIGQFSWFHFDTSNDDLLYVSFEPDSLIYVYDDDLNNIKTFGCAGENMNTDYIESSNLEQTGMMLFEERSEKGYYTDLKYIDGANLLFRSYQKGVHSKSDGLQIYKDNSLIGDVNVPKGFKVMGYKSPYFYSEGFIDEDYEEMHMLRFKLDGLKIEL